MALCAYCGQGFVPVLVGQSGTALGLSWVRAGVCQSSHSTKLQGLSLCYPTKSFCWWVESALRPDVLLQPTAGNAAEQVCMAFFPSSWDGSHFEVVLTLVGAHHYTCGATSDGWIIAKVMGV